MQEDSTEVTTLAASTGAGRTKVARESGHTRLQAGQSTIDVVEANDRWTVAVAGRVTVDASPRLRSVLLELLGRIKAPVVVIDFSAVSYVDMSGIAILFEALKAAREHNIALRVEGMSGQVSGLAEIAQLEKIFHLWGSEVQNR